MITTVILNVDVAFYLEIEPSNQTSIHVQNNEIICERKMWHTIVLAKWQFSLLLAEDGAVTLLKTQYVCDE